MQAFHALLRGVDAHWLTHFLLNEIIHQNGVILKPLVLIDERNEENVRLDIFHLNETQLDIGVEVLLHWDLGRLGTFIGDLILFSELEVPHFLELNLCELVLRLVKLDLIFLTNQGDFAFAFENCFHLILCLGDEEVRFLKKRPLFAVRALLIVNLVILTDDGKNEALILLCCLVWNQSHLGQIRELIRVSLVSHYLNLLCYTFHVWLPIILIETRIFFVIHFISEIFIQFFGRSVIWVYFFLRLRFQFILLFVIGVV